METLKKALERAMEEKKAVGHFNIADMVALDGIVEAARKLSVPVIVGLSEGERAFVGTRRAVALVRTLREEYAHPIYLNADHTHTLEGIKEVVDAGFDAAVFDPVAKARKEEIDFSFDDHIRVTKEAVAYAKSVNPDFLIEGEMGYIGSSSSWLEDIPAGADIAAEALTRPELAKQFIKESGADLLAPSVGNIHGMFKHAANPRLDIERIREIREKAGVALVLHGGSGIRDEDFVAAIDAGMAIVHINTEIRVAWRKALERSLGQNLEEVAPYKLLEASKEAVASVVEKRLRLFNRI